MEDLTNISEGFHRFSPTADINPRFHTSQIKKGLKYVTGWWCNNHLEKYESQWEG
jgi:hypothetical protein